jgi:YgiT-type zinc finger domain-containing protein
MDCAICKNGTTKPDYATLTLDRDGSIVIFKEVPAQVCNNCGHAYFDQATTSKLFELAEDTIKKGIEVEIRNLKSAV